MSQFAEAVKRYWGSPVPAHLKHGSNTWACQVYGCDCALCLPSGKRHRPAGEGRTAAERQRDSREKLRGTPVPEGTKHGTYTYRVYGCRCDICRESRRESWARTQERKQEGRRGHWEERANGVTVVHWPPADRPWLCPVCDFKKIEEA